MEQPTSLKKIARTTGVLYFILALMGIYVLEYVPSQIVVAGNDAATSQKILDHEFLYRTQIAVDMIANVLYIYLAMLFYRLFKSVNEFQARMLVAFVLVEITIAFLLDTFVITGLLILKRDILQSLQAEEAQKLAVLLRRMRGNGIGMVEIFWGMWLFPMGILSYRSGFIPRIVGVLVMVTGVAYVVSSLTFVLFPAFDDTLDKFIFPFYMGELAIVFWLLIRGVKNKYKEQMV